MGKQQEAHRKPPTMGVYVWMRIMIIYIVCLPKYRAMLLCILCAQMDE